MAKKSSKKSSRKAVKLTPASAASSFGAALVKIRRAVKAVQEQKANGLPNPGVVIGQMAEARKAYIDAKTASLVLSQFGAFHSDFSRALRDAESFINGAGDIEREALEFAQYAAGGQYPDTEGTSLIPTDPNEIIDSEYVAGLGGFRGRGRRRCCRRRR